MDAHGFIRVIGGAALAGLLGVSAAAAAIPTLTLVIDKKVLGESSVEVGFLKDAPSDNAVIKVYEGTVTTGDVDLKRRLTQKGGIRSATLEVPGTYTLTFTGFVSSCSPKLYLTLPQLRGANYVATFTAKGDTRSEKITIKDLVCDKNAARYFQFPTDGVGSIKVTSPN